MNFNQLIGQNFPLKPQKNIQQNSIKGILKNHDINVKNLSYLINQSYISAYKQNKQFKQNKPEFTKKQNNSNSYDNLKFQDSIMKNEEHQKNYCQNIENSIFQVQNYTNFEDKHDFSSGFQQSHDKNIDYRWKEDQTTLRINQEKKTNQIYENLKSETHEFNNQQNNLLKNAEIQYKLRLESLAKQYQLRLQKQNELHRLQIWRLQQDIQTYAAQKNNNKNNIIKFQETTSLCSYCSDGEIIKSLKKIIDNLSKDHDQCLNQKRNYTLKYTELQRQHKQMSNNLNQLKKQNQNLKSNIQKFQLQIRQLKTLIKQKTQKYQKSQKYQKNQLKQKQNLYFQNPLQKQQPAYSVYRNKNLQLLQKLKAKQNYSYNDTKINSKFSLNQSYIENKPAYKYTLNNTAQIYQYTPKENKIITNKRPQSLDRRKLNISDEDVNINYNNETFRPSNLRRQSYRYNI